jgi:membrane protein YdbS with pleckstrin-like domain
MGNRRLLLGTIAAVLVIWLVGAAVTRYSVEQMAYFAPIAVAVVGATAAIVLLWVKVVLQLRDERRQRRGFSAEQESAERIPARKNS